MWICLWRQPSPPYLTTSVSITIWKTAGEMLSSRVRDYFMNEWYFRYLYSVGWSAYFWLRATWSSKRLWCSGSKRPTYWESSRYVANSTMCVCHILDLLSIFYADLCAACHTISQSSWSDREELLWHHWRNSSWMWTESLRYLVTFIHSAVVHYRLWWCSKF